MNSVVQGAAAPPLRRRSHSSAQVGTGAGRYVGRPAPQLTTLLGVVVAVYLGVHALGLTRQRDHAVWLEVYVEQAAVLLAALLCAVRGARFPRERLAWFVLAAGIACDGVAASCYNRAYLRGGPVPFPSWVDAVWLAFFPCAWFALCALARVRIHRPRLTFGLDGLVLGFTVAAYLSQFLVAPRFAEIGYRGRTAVVLLAYPVGALLLLTLTLAVPALAGWRIERPWSLLVPAFVLTTGAQVAFVAQALHGGYRPGGWLQAPWLLGLVLAAFAAGSRRPPLRRDLTGRAVLWIPVTALLAAVGLMAFTHDVSTRPTTLVPAAAAILLALARMGLTLREVRIAGDGQRLAYTDDLTGLANRRAFYAATGTLTDGPANRALLLIDLDRFKEVNDTLGHLAGDQLLAQVGPRLLRCLDPGDLIARIGGDEFAVLLADAGAARARHVAGLLRAALGRGVEVEGVRLEVDATIGVALLPDHGTDVHTLLRCADVAMYQAKAARTGVRVYEIGRDPHGLERLQTVAELRTAISGGQLVVHYQPKGELRTGAVHGVEALVRWQHPQRGLLTPGVFLPLVEQAGLTPALTVAVLRASLRQVAAWRAAGTVLSVAVNLSPSSLVDAELPRRVAGLLAEYGLPACALQLEITEEFLIKDRVRARAVLGQVRGLGVRVSVDDYGTGYSSLAYLRELPIDELKLDRSFVAPMVTDPGAAAIVRSTIDLAHSLGLRIVAEGVETAAAWDALLGYGCDLAQGYFLSPALPGDLVLPWLRSRPARRGVRLTVA